MTISQYDNQTILVVDDNPDNLRLLAGILNEHEYKVRRGSGPCQNASDVAFIAAPD